MLKKAFTMMEIVTVLAIIAIISAVTISATQKKLEKIDTAAYYAAYDITRDIAVNIVAQTEYDYTATEILADPTNITAASAADFCKAITNDYNVSDSHCDITAAQMKSNTSANFKNVTPQIKLSNGMNIYITSNLEKIAKLDDATDNNDRVGYTIWIDVNGNKGNGTKYWEVLPFYILMSGKILPVFTIEESGAIVNVPLYGNILYDDYSTGKRIVKVSQTNIYYRTGACATKYITSPKYCTNISVDNNCKTEDSDCRFVVNQPIKIFGR